MITTTEEILKAIKDYRIVLSTNTPYIYMNDIEYIGEILDLKRVYCNKKDKTVIELGSSDSGANIRYTAYSTYYTFMLECVFQEDCKIPSFSTIEEAINWAVDSLNKLEERFNEEYYQPSLEKLVKILKK